MKKLFLCLFTAACLFSCSNDDEDVFIQLTGNTETSQVIYADETSKPDGIKFTATAPWTATVIDATSTRSSEVDWLSLNMYSGGAGEHTLTMTLLPNQTGEDRKAVIEITCSSTTIRIQVEQKGTTADGEDMPSEGGGTVSKQYVDNIVQRWEEENGNWEQSIVKFTYNLDGTVSSILCYSDTNNNGIIDDNERNNNLEWKTEFTYDKANNKVFAESTDYEDNSVKTSKLQLNSDGYATEAIYGESGYGQTETYRISYQNGYISNVEATEQGDTSKYIETPEWQNGNLVKISGSRDSELYGYSDITYGEVRNLSDVSIDLNFIISNSEWYDSLAEDGNYGLKVCDLFGKRSERMMSYEREIDLTNGDGTAQECSYTYTYETDENGLITKITVDNNGGDEHSNSNSVYTINYQR